MWYQRVRVSGGMMGAAKGIQGDILSRKRYEKPWTWAPRLAACCGLDVLFYRWAQERSNPPREARVRTPFRGSWRSGGFTIIEVMVVIAIVAIATAVAVPDMTSWVVNAHIRNAAGDFQGNMQWARAYALKTDQNVNMQLTSVNMGSQTVCTWFIAVATAPAVAIAGAPTMSATDFKDRYSNINCTLAPGTTLPLTFTPEGMIMAPQAVSGAPVVADSYLLFSAATNAAKFTSWLVKYYGAGELRSCVATPVTASSPVPTCALR